MDTYFNNADVDNIIVYCICTTRKNKTGYTTLVRQPDYAS